MADWSDVADVAGSLPSTVETGPRTWRVGKKLVVWERPLRPADRAALADAAPTGDVLGARVPDEGVKFALVTSEPDVYFTTPHFDGYPAVLVRLAVIRPPELRELITEAWLTQAPRRLVKDFLDQHPVR